MNDPFGSMGTQGSKMQKKEISYVPEAAEGTKIYV